MKDKNSGSTDVMEKQMPKKHRFLIFPSILTLPHERSSRGQDSFYQNEKFVIQSFQFKVTQCAVHFYISLYFTFWYHDIITSITFD